MPPIGDIRRVGVAALAVGKEAVCVRSLALFLDEDIAARDAQLDADVRAARQPRLGAEAAAELKENSRARSAKLRVVEKCDPFDI